MLAANRTVNLTFNSFDQIHKALFFFLSYDQWVGKKLEKEGFGSCPILSFMWLMRRVDREGSRDDCPESWKRLKGA